MNINKNNIAKILTIVFFTLAVLILLITLLLVYTPLKDLLFKKPIAEITSEELTEEPIATKKEETTIEPTEQTTDESEEETTKISIEMVKEPFSGTSDITEMIYQGAVLEIDYENKIIKIENVHTGKVEILECNKLKELGRAGIEVLHTEYSEGPLGNLRPAEFEDIEVGHYIVASIIAETGIDEPTEFHKENWDVIDAIFYTEERWW